MIFFYNLSSFYRNQKLVMTKTNSWSVYVSSVEGFGGNDDDHPPPSNTILSPTTTTIHFALIFHFKQLFNQKNFFLTTLLQIFSLSSPRPSSRPYLQHPWIFLVLPMEQRALFGLSLPSKSTSLFMILLVSFIQLQSLVVEGAILDDDSSKVLCDMDLSSFLPLPYGSLPNMVCKPLWNSYVLRVIRFMRIV